MYFDHIPSHNSYQIIPTSVPLNFMLCLSKQNGNQCKLYISDKKY